MFKRIFNKSSFKKLVKAGGLILLLGMTLMIGYTLGEAEGHLRGRQIGADTQIIVEIPERPDIPRRPERPQLPELPVRPTLPERIPAIERIVMVDQGPSFFGVLSTVSNVIIGLALIGLGLVMIRKHDRQSKEKTPDSLAR